MIQRMHFRILWEDNFLLSSTSRSGGSSLGFRAGRLLFKPESTKAIKKLQKVDVSVAGSQGIILFKYG